MKLDIISRKKNPSLFREELVLSIKESKTTPSIKELRQKIAAMLNKKEDEVVIKKIEQNYGSSKISCLARTYNSKEKAIEIEPKYVINRNLGIKKKKAGEEKKAAKPEQPKKKEGKEGATEGKGKEKAWGEKPAAKKEEVKEAPKEEKAAGEQEKKGGSKGEKVEERGEESKGEM